MQYQVMDNFRVANGTFLVGMISATYEEMKQAFGRPLKGDGDKTRAEWVVLFDTDEGDVVATVYDWKCSEIPIEDVQVWNVGGKSIDALMRIEDAIAYVRDMNAHDDEQARQWELSYE